MNDELGQEIIYSLSNAGEDFESKKNLGGFFFDEEKSYVCCVFLSAQQSLSEIIDA